MFDSVTTTKGEVTATGATIEFNLSSQADKTASGIGLAVHNGNDFTTCSVDLEIFTGTWNNVASFDIFNITTPALVEFTETPLTQCRLVFTFTGGSGSLFIANITVGTATTLPCGMQTGYTSPQYGNNDTVNYNRTLGGQLAGLNSKKQGTEQTIPIKFMSEKWARANAPDIIEHVSLYPFYFRWDSIDSLNADDTFFGWLDGAKPKPSWSSRQYLEMSISANGITDNG